ncbi:MAG: type IV toxin-antitoxin system AbiEi family antitoxin domain-containing protein [Bdellovibrionales bacterium]|nr:type IV toxin-antitoxin system AbiEi family antitoxin domain-containing protein [Bdellovibrionales bacterium]
MKKGTLKLNTNRKKLSLVAQSAGDFVRIEDAEKILNLSRIQSAKLLSQWASQGWLRRVGVGTYVPVPLDLLTSKQVVEDPWILVPTLFSPAYIGGRTATEYWDLTEQIFRDIVVFTSRPVRSRRVKSQSVTFTLKTIKKEKIFGTQIVWRGQTQVAVSDVYKTLIDMVDDPSIGGGIQHISDCFDNFMKQKHSKKPKDSSQKLDNYKQWKEHSFKKLIFYAEQLGNGAVFKRLGFLAERHPEGYDLAVACKKNLTQGNAKLDSSLKCDHLITRWRLWIPKSWLRKVVL